MGREFELKYRATPAQQAAILKEYGDFTPITMETTYFDTLDGALSASRITLRRRFENGTSVCTVKTPADQHGRGEWETECDDINAAIPILCKLGCPVDLIPLCEKGITPICGAKFTRLAGLLELPGCTAELALDTGVLLGGGREIPLCEVELELNSFVTVADASKVKVYMKNFGEFYNNQIETASTIILSRTDSAPQAKLDASVALIREHNEKATIVTTPWNQLTGEQLIEAMEGQATLAAELAKLEQEHQHHHHEEHECCCGHHDHEHHHHHEEHECGCGHHHEEHHHHDHDENCTCGCHDHDHDHHHHHHADEVFTSWGVETHKKFDKAAVEHALHHLDSGEYGMVLRAKGIIEGNDGSWIHFDYVPEEHNVRTGSAAITGKLCVIGSKLDEKAIAALFGV